MTILDMSPSHRYRVYRNITEVTTMCTCRGVDSNISYALTTFAVCMH